MGIVKLSVKNTYNEMKKEKEYYAFISYKREDEKWAKWLQDKLEHYHFPTNLNGRTDLPTYIRPTFRDVTDLTPGLLTEEIDKALRSSEWLIVICSPRSAKSPWVCKEAQTFIDLGRAKHIIPFVIEGAPFSNNTLTECYPESLLNLTGSRELLAANINEMGRVAAVIKVVARMFNLRFDVLWQRHERRRKKIRNIWLAVIILFLSCVSLYYIRMCSSLKYYVDFVECYGVPMGIHEIEKKDVSNRYVSYKFVYKRKRLFESGKSMVRIERINSHGTPIKWFPSFEYPLEGSLKNQYPIIEISDNGLSFYDEKGNIQEKREYSTMNTSEGILLLSDIKRTSPKIDREYEIINERNTRANINRYCYVLDNEGYYSKITYHNNSSGNLNESACANNMGAYGYSIIRDSLQRITSLFVLNSLGKLDVDYSKVCHFQQIHSKWGVQSISAFDLKDGPILSSDLANAHSIKSTFDAYGNVVKSEDFGVDMKPHNSFYGFAIQRIDYVKGCPIESINTDKHDKRTNNIEMKVSRISSSFDAKGRVIKETFYDVNDRICLNADGYAIIEYEYDKNNNVIRKSVYDENYSPTLSRLNGYATLLMEYNKKGQVVLSTSLGINGEKIINKRGFCIQKTIYSRSGIVAGVEFYDCDGNLTIAKEEGYAMSRCDVGNDRNGNTIYTFSVYGKERTPINDKERLAHKWTSVFNDLGQYVEESYYGTNGELCLNSLGYARAEYKYDSKGRIVTKRFYDCEGKYTVLYNKIGDNAVIGGFAMDSIAYISDRKFITYRMDERGIVNDCDFCSAIELTETRGDTLLSTYYNKNFIRATNYDGYAMRMVVCDDLRRPIDIQYFNQDSVRCDSRYGFSRMQYVFDERGNLIKSSYYDKGDNLVDFNNAGAVLCLEYDGRDNVSLSYALDVDKKRYMSKEQSFGLLKKYDNKDRLIETIFIDTIGNPYQAPYYSISRAKYDIRGNLIEESYYDIHGNSVNCGRGFHIARYEYDEYYNQTSIRYFDSDYNATLVDGYHFIKKKYNVNRLIEDEYYDTKEAYMGKYKYIYDAYNNIDQVIRIDNLTGSQRAYQRLAIYENNGKDAYVIIEWEHWNISQPINNYLRSLIQLTSFTAKKVLVYNPKKDSYEYKIVDNESFISAIVLPEHVFLSLRHYYENKKTLGSNCNMAI